MVLWQSYIGTGQWSTFILCILGHRYALLTVLEEGISWISEGRNKEEDDILWLNAYRMITNLLTIHEAI